MTQSPKDRSLEDGSSGADADDAVDGEGASLDRRPFTPYARPAEPMEADHDQLAAKLLHAEDRQEALIDEALEETFPSSDPISPKQIS